MHNQHIIVEKVEVVEVPERKLTERWTIDLEPGVIEIDDDCISELSELLHQQVNNRMK